MWMCVFACRWYTPVLHCPGKRVLFHTSLVCYIKVQSLSMMFNLFCRYLNVALVTADFHETSILSAKALHCWAGMRLLGSLESSVLC